jgi:hypothetical protein
MDHLTNLYKNRCENLQEKINHYKNLLNEGGLTDVVKMVRSAGEIAKASEIAKAAAEVTKAPKEIAKEFKPLAQASADIVDTSKAWETANPGRQAYERSMASPLGFNRQFLTQPIGSTRLNIKDIESLGGVVPDIQNPLATLTGEEILQGIYGKKAQTYADLADRAQKLALKQGTLQPEKVTEFLPPDYSKKGLKAPVDIHVGTHMGSEGKHVSDSVRTPGTLDPNPGAAAFNMPSPMRTSNGEKIPAINMNIAQVGDPRVVPNLPDIIAHEWTHASGHNNPNFTMSGIMDYGHNTPGNITNNLLSAVRDNMNRDRLAGGDVPRYFENTIPSTAYGSVEHAYANADWMHKMPRGTAKDIDNAKDLADLPQSSVDYMRGEVQRSLGPNTSLETFFPTLQNYMRDTIAKEKAHNIDYLSNREIPAQIASAKAWMEKKGLPHIDSNMSHEVSKVLGAELVDKFKRGMFPEIKGQPQIMQMLDMLQHPKGKKLFDLIATKNKGSDVSKKISDMQKA